MTTDDASAPVSVVVPARDAASTLDAQLEALLSQEYDGEWEVVVADNGSTDGTAAVVRRWRERSPQLRLVDASRRRGVNAARNAGVASSSGTYVLLADADDLVEPGWIAAMAGALDTFDLAGGTLRDWDGDVLAPPRAAVVRDSFSFLPYAIGACLAFRAEVWRAVGGFDETIRDGGDEIDLCWRAQLAGFSLGRAPDAIVRYRTRPVSELSTRRRYCSSHPWLYRRFRSVGMPRSSTVGAVRTWAGLVTSWRPGAAVGPRVDRSRALALRSGRVLGSLRHRVLYL